MEDYLPISTQLNILFEERLHVEQRPYMLKEVSEATGISVGTLSQLRTGRIENPQLNTLREICHFFDVPLRYFETRTMDECYAILTSKEDKSAVEINEIAFRATNLSEQSQQDILNIIKWVQAAEELRKQGLDLPPLPGLEGDNE
jgi:transcriptional regulator with XRE-family HTH domain